MENTADITHTFFLHGYMLYQQGVRGRQVEQYYRPYERYGYQRFEWGVLKSWRYAGGGTELGPEHSAGAPLIFPNILRVVQPPWHTMHWRVPIDDVSTTIIWAGFQRGVAPVSKEELENPPIVDIPPQKHPDGTYRMDTFYSQDKMAWETQGPIMDRSNEHLGASDRGVVLYRQMLREQIEVVQAGGEPMCLIRDPAQNAIIELPELVAEADTEDLGARLSTTLSGRTMAEYLDERHEIFEVPFGTARWPEA